jgi:hypothetical protein
MLGQPFTLKDLAPVAEGEVAGDQEAGTLVALGEDLEQQSGSRAARTCTPTRRRSTSVTRCAA